MSHTPVKHAGESLPSPNYEATTLKKLHTGGGQLVASCGICHDSYELVRVGLESDWRMVRGVCSCRYCRSCLRDWIAASLNSQHTRPRCPSTDCSYIMHIDDVGRVSPRLGTELRRILALDYQQRLHKIKEEGGDLEKWVEENAKTCPDCHVIVQKNEGCSSILCLCGTRFCWICGRRGELCQGHLASE